MTSSIKMAGMISWYPVALHDLTHWGRVTHICVGNLTTIASDNGLSPGRRQALIWTSAGILLIRPLGTNFSEILIEIHTFSFKKMHLQMSSAKRWLFCPGLNDLTTCGASNLHALEHYDVLPRMNWCCCAILIWHRTLKVLNGIPE